MTQKLHPETLAIRGSKFQTEYNEHNQALFLTSSFMFDTAADGAALFAGQKAGFTYSRTANPTVAAFNQRISQLEGAEQSVSMATGMAAIQAALLTFLSADDHLVCSKSLFGTTMGFLTNHVKRFGIDITFVSQTDLDEWRAAVRPNTKMFFFGNAVQSFERSGRFGISGGDCARKRRIAGGGQQFSDACFAAAFEMGCGFVGSVGNQGD